MTVQLPQIKKTAVDRVIEYFNPVLGAKRQSARLSLALGNSFTGASRKKNSLKNWLPWGKSADADILPEVKTLRDRSRDLERNDPLAHGAVNNVVTNVVGSGLTMQCNIDADYLGMSEQQSSEWQANTEREFRLYSESLDCDLTRTQTFAWLQDLAFRSALTNGDSFALTPRVAVPGFPYKTRIQLIESDRICNKDDKPDTNEHAGGIKLDEYGAPESVDILTVHPGSIKRAKKEWETVPYYGAKTGRRNVIHLFERRRIGQNRGIPYLAPVIEPLKQLGRYTDSELMSAVVSSFFTVFIKTEDGQGSLIGSDAIEANQAASNAQRNYELGNANIIEGLPGDSIETINPGRPNSEFDPFVNAIFKQIGIALELPVEILMKSFTSSYSASRAAILDAWKFYKRRRSWLATMFCQPIYETWLAEAIAIGRISAPGFFQDPMVRKAYSKATWHGDGMGSIDPYKEVNAAEKRMNINLTSLAEEKAAYDGGDWEATLKQRKKEINAGVLPVDSGTVIEEEPERAEDQK